MKQKKHSIILVTILLGLILVSCAKEVSIEKLILDAQALYMQENEDAATEKMKQVVQPSNFKPSTLSQECLDSVKDNLDVIFTTYCFLFTEQLSNEQRILFCDGLCWFYYDRHFNTETMLAFQENYPAAYIEEHGQVIIEKDVLDRMLYDFLGISDIDLKSYYSDLQKTELDNQQTINESFSNRDDVYAYFAWDPGTPILHIREQYSLGDGFHYIIIEQIWPDVEMIRSDDMHILIRESDTFFRFQLISVLQTVDESLLSDLEVDIP